MSGQPFIHHLSQAFRSTILWLAYISTVLNLVDNHYGVNGHKYNPICFIYSSVLGCSTDGSSTYFVSSNALKLIYEEIFLKLLSFIQSSSFSWVRSVASVLSSDAKVRVEFDSSVNISEMAQFALEVLDGSFLCLKTLDGESELVSGILSAIFVIDWECNLGKALVDSLDDETGRRINDRFAYGESVHTFRHKLNRQFWKNISIDIHRRLGTTLIQSVRSAIFIEDKLINDKIISFSCTWVLEVLECLAMDGNEEQNLLFQLLSRCDTWPLFIVPNFVWTKVLNLNVYTKI